MCMSDTERARIESCPQARIDGRGNVFWGPVGIAMTRALGDAILLRAGVLPWPIVERYELLACITLSYCRLSIRAAKSTVSCDKGIDRFDNVSLGQSTKKERT